MYMSEKPQDQEVSAIDFYLSKEGSPNENNMIIPISDGGDDPTASATANQIPSNPPPHSPAPKKRAEAWAQEETRALISLRKEIDFMFNTSKSNKHLWENISMKMRDNGFDRSPTMCTDKWRNLLKEYKKAQQKTQDKMSFYKDIEEIMRERSKNGYCWKNSADSNDAAAAADSKVDSFMQFADKGIDDASLTFGPVEGNGRPTLNLERRLDHEVHPLAITVFDAVGASGASPWNWRDPSENGDQRTTYGGRVITVKLGQYTKRIGIDGTANAIKDAIKSAFRLRTKRTFWLEDEDNVVRSLDRDMPLGNYTLHVDEGLTIKVCLYDGAEHLPLHTEDKTFYTDDDFHEFLSRRCWTCLREYDGYRNIDSMDELCAGALYRGVN